MSSDFKPGDAVAQQVQRIPRSGIREFFDLVQGRRDIISLGVGEPDFVTPWHIRESAIYALERGHTVLRIQLLLPHRRRSRRLRLLSVLNFGEHVFLCRERGCPLAPPLRFGPFCRVGVLCGILTDLLLDLFSH